MKISVIAKPNAKKTEVSKIDEAIFRVYVKESPRDNKANRAIEAAIATYFKIPSSSVRVIQGHRSQHKILALRRNPLVE